MIVYSQENTEVHPIMPVLYFEPFVHILRVNAIKLGHVIRGASTRPVQPLFLKVKQISFLQNRVNKSTSVILHFLSLLYYTIIDRKGM